MDAKKSVSVCPVANCASPSAASSAPATVSRRSRITSSFHVRTPSTVTSRTPAQESSRSSDVIAGLTWSIGCPRSIAAA